MRTTLRVWWQDFYESLSRHVLCPTFGHHPTWKLKRHRVQAVQTLESTMKPDQLPDIVLARRDYTDSVCLYIHTTQSPEGLPAQIDGKPVTVATVPEGSALVWKD